MNIRNNELSNIQKTVQFYIDGVREGNTKMLRKAFHPKAMMYGSSGDNVTIVDIEGLYAFVDGNEAPSKKGEPYQCFFTAIDYAGNVAFVEMTEESSHGFDFTNLFQLLKINDNWVIVSKAYNAVKKS